MKLKATNAEKLLVMHQNEEREQTTTTLDEKKAKFEEYKHLLDKQVCQTYPSLNIIIFFSRSKLI